MVKVTGITQAGATAAGANIHARPTSCDVLARSEKNLPRGRFFSLIRAALRLVNSWSFYNANTPERLFERLLPKPEGPSTEELFWVLRRSLVSHLLRKGEALAQKARRARTSDPL
jgi:hypothetical protein